MPTATFVVVASMVGTGILVSPGYGIQALESYPLLFALWGVGGVLALCGALTVAELASAMPKAGGEYVYLREAYGALPAFLAGWTSFVVGFSAPLAINAQLAARYLTTPLGLTEDAGAWLRTAVGIGLIVAVTAPNVLGHRQSAWTQGLTTLLKLGLLVTVVLAGFTLGTGSWENLAVGRPAGEIPFGDMASQMFFIMLAYSGWNAASYVAGEVRDPGRTLPRSLVGGCGLVVVLYLALNLVFAYALPVADATAIPLEEMDRFALIAVGRLFGSGVSQPFMFALGLAILASMNAWVITGPRVYYAMARDGLFPAWAGVLGARSGLPARAMVAQSLFAIGILCVGTFEGIYRYTAVGLSLFSMLFIAAVFVLRWRRPDLLRPFRTPLYPVVPAVYLLFTLWMTWHAFQLWPKESATSVGSILAGVPVYFVWTRLLGGERPSA
jgi:APA family basic amino acid/polyamine antiporter